MSEAERIAEKLLDGLPFIVCHSERRESVYDGKPYHYYYYRNWKKLKSLPEAIEYALSLPEVDKVEIRVAKGRVHDSTVEELRNVK